MARPRTLVLGGTCQNGHRLTNKTLRTRTRGSGSYCLRCHAMWNKTKYWKKKSQMTCEATGAS